MNAHDLCDNCTIEIENVVIFNILGPFQIYVLSPQWRLALHDVEILGLLKFDMELFSNCGKINMLVW